MDSRFILLLSVVFASIGQVLFKKGMSGFNLGGLGNNLQGIIRTLAGVIFSPFVFSGLVFYVLSTLLWLFALSKTDLSQTYPFTLLTFILVMLASIFIFHETMTMNRIIGSLIIFGGVIVVSLK